jgi:hypothetical protein
VAADAAREKGRQTVYITIWRNKHLTMQAKTIEEMADGLRDSSASLREMADAGVKLRDGQEDDYAILVTDDKEVAERFGLIEEGDFCEGEGEDETDA